MFSMKKWSNKLSDESGVTLVELLAALAILAIIVTAFLAFFIQSARTTSQASDVNTATFLAQQEMEEMVYYSSNSVFPEGYEKNGKHTRTDLNYTIETVITKIDDSNLYSVIVKVYETDTVRSIMENRLPFDEE